MVLFRNAFKVIPDSREDILEHLLAQAVEGDIQALALAILVREIAPRGLTMQEVFKYCEGKYLNMSPTLLNPEGEVSA